jgi:hypothetical protein
VPPSSVLILAAQSTTSDARRCSSSAAKRWVGTLSPTSPTTCPAGPNTGAAMPMPPSRRSYWLNA